MRRQLPDAEITTIKLASPDARLVDRDFACDWLISYLCPWVLPASVLEQAARNLNFHPGPPEYPGIGCYNFALYEGAESFGVTCHQMLPKVDSGAIYAVRRFPIPAMATVDVLQDIAHATMMALYLELIESIGKGEPVEAVTDERWTKEATTTRDMERLRSIPLDADSRKPNGRSVPLRIAIIQVPASSLTVGASIYPTTKFRPVGRSSNGFTKRTSTL